MTIATDPLAKVREAIIRVIELNPHTYSELQSYRRLVKRERELVAKEYPRPAQRPLAELKAIVEADNRRFWELGEIWSDLTEVQQRDLIDTARAMAQSREGHSVKA